MFTVIARRARSFFAPSVSRALVVDCALHLLVRVQENLCVLQQVVFLVEHAAMLLGVLVLFLTPVEVAQRWLLQTLAAHRAEVVRVVGVAALRTIHRRDSDFVFAVITPDSCHLSTVVLRCTHSTFAAP